MAAPAAAMRRVASTASTAVTITNPLVKYRALVATGVYEADPAQHRLAYHLSKIYDNLKDYVPRPEYRDRLRQLTRSLDEAHGGGGSRAEKGDGLAVLSHPIRRNPLFAKLFSAANRGRDSLALTRVLASYEEAELLDSPRGLFLSGDVGTGKSMLLDLLADGLPTSHKRRWHFNTFMLYAFSALEKQRKQQDRVGAGAGAADEYALLVLAREMVSRSPILFLDEFQLPDRAASKILSTLLVLFFQLGGVLVASSNRMPEELERAAGTYYSPQQQPWAGGLLAKFRGPSRQATGALYGQSSEFAAFLAALRARCDFWHLEGTRDWRRLEARSGGGDSPEKPSRYALLSDDEAAWREMVDASLQRDGKVETTTPAWQHTHLVVYGRTVTVPRQRDGVCYWDFDELVGSFGPADYITLTSHFHTFIVADVPVLTLAQKNEARRFITLLDALYEARCKLVIRAAVGPDELFFPEAEADGHPDPEVSDDLYSETIAEVFQDQVAPFRPNVSDYSEPTTTDYDADKDSNDANNSNGNNSINGNNSMDSDVKVDFSRTGSAFTGEDERFAYKRATSRLWEMCSGQWHARSGHWWNPLPPEARHWEGPAEDSAQSWMPKVVGGEQGGRKEAPSSAGAAPSRLLHSQ